MRKTDILKSLTVRSVSTSQIIFDYTPYSPSLSLLFQVCGEPSGIYLFQIDPSEDAEGGNITLLLTQNHAMSSVTHTNLARFT